MLGEYSYLREEDSDPGSVMRLLARLLDQRHTSTETRSWVLGAMTKLCSSPVSVALARDVCERYLSSLCPKSV